MSSHLKGLEFQREDSAPTDPGGRTAIMCAEALPWRCHRRLIADVFVLDGWQVLDLMPSGRLEQHLLPPFARPAEDGLPLYGTGGEPLFGDCNAATVEVGELRRT